MTVASNALVKIGIKGSVSTLCRDSQRPEDAPMLMHGTTPFFSEEAELKMVNAVAAMRLLKAHVT